MSVQHLVSHLYQSGCSPREHAHQCHEYIKCVTVWNPCKHRWEEHIERVRCVWDPCKHRFVEHVTTIQVIVKNCWHHCWHHCWQLVRHCAR